MGNNIDEEWPIELYHFHTKIMIFLSHWVIEIYIRGEIKKNSIPFFFHRTTAPRPIRTTDNKIRTRLYRRSSENPTSWWAEKGIWGFVEEAFSFLGWTASINDPRGHGVKIFRSIFYFFSPFFYSKKLYPLKFAEYFSNPFRNSSLLSDLFFKKQLAHNNKFLIFRTPIKFLFCSDRAIDSQSI